VTIGRTLLYALLAVTIAFVVLLLIAATTSRPVSAEALRYFSRDYIEKARSYGLGSYIVYGLRLLLEIGFYVLLIWGPLGPYLIRVSRHWGGERYYVVLALFTVFVLVLLRLVVFPLSFYRSYIYEHQWGLSNRSLALYFSDYFKGMALSLLFTVPGIWVLYSLVRWSPDRWWVWIAAGYAVWNVVAIMLSPIIIDPLFYEFTPLEDQELRERVVTLAQKAELEVDEVLVMNASSRTKKVNAYFTGFGGTKRVVLYDNLVENFSRDEVELVLAHELGHWKHQHINKCLGLLVGSSCSG